MAKALVYARTGDTKYRDTVIWALRSIENSGTYNGRCLALGRELAAYVISADLIGYRETAFINKVRELRNTRRQTDRPTWSSATKSARTTGDDWRAPVASRWICISATQQTSLERCSFTAAFSATDPPMPALILAM